MNIEGLPPLPVWDDKGATIDLGPLDSLIDDVLVNWGIEIDWSEGEPGAQVARQIGPGEAVEQTEIYSLLRDLVQAAFNDKEIAS